MSSEQVSPFAISRRQMLAGLAGCSAAASPLLTPASFARTPSEHRLVVILLRGAMDGLSAAEPYGDAELARLRPGLALGGDALMDLDGRFGLHPALSPVSSWVGEGALSIAHAVSTPYRDERSHFDGQDVLETGGGKGASLRDGWLNRAVARIPGASLQTAVAVGGAPLLILDGAADVTEWSPRARLKLRPDARAMLDQLYAEDPLFDAAYKEAVALGKIEPMRGKDAAGVRGLAGFAGKMLSAEARIAAFSIGGWDTHRAQAATIKRPLGQLAEAMTVLRETLGAVWRKTLVIAVTEFGRTARENGVGGTDHGTAGAAFLAGGMLSGKRVLGRWPGLKDGDLYQNRDLAPTEDVRRYTGHALRALFGLSTAEIERDIFPGVTLGAEPGMLA
ncbi:MAG: DUF1501 domain-containing protein [Neomegalonema sp.]|nr:DUF1501 domain-containing protein [Neomegalonema sp.]